MNVARFAINANNASEIEQLIKNFCDARSAYMEEHMCNPSQIYLDMQGVKINTGKNKNHYSVYIQTGQILTIHVDKNFEGTSNEIGCSYKDLIKVVYPGLEFKMGNDDGLACKVKAVYEDRIEVECLNEYVLGENQAMNIPGAKRGREEDRAAILRTIEELCKNYPIDKVGLSFVNDAKAVRDFKMSLASVASEVQIVSKIDSLEGIRNYEEILQESDAIKIDRTSLDKEIQTEKVFAV